VVIHGAEDPIVLVEGGKDVTANIPEAELRIIRGMEYDRQVALVGGIADAIESASVRARSDGVK
jgi:hypothetical protein